MRFVHRYEFRTLLQAQRRRLVDASQEGQELRQVDQALVRIADGSYGLCVGCGAEISRERLKTSPALEHCPRCSR